MRNRERSSTLAKPNPSFEKRRRERAKRERREEKARRKAERKAAAEKDSSVGVRTVEGASEEESSTDDVTEEQAKELAGILKVGNGSEEDKREGEQGGHSPE
jgi:hypothetical protein